jgi:hypothetical protein
MADHYTKFACLLDVGSAENAARAIQIHHELATEIEHDDGASLGFEMEPINRSADGQLLLYSEDYGEPEHVVLFVRRCAKQLNLAGKWGFSWALCCSRPRIESFGGGACLLDLGSGDMISSMTTGDWLESAIAAAGAVPAERSDTAAEVGGKT